MQQRQELVKEANYVGDEEDTLKEPHDLAEFKGIAQCAERAAVANNLLEFAGMETTYITGKIHSEDKSPELHAYLILTGNSGKKYIYDPTNPFMIFSAEDHRLVQTQPAIHPGAEPVLEGGSMESTLLEYETDEEGGANITREKPIVFYGDQFKAYRIK